ncbi:25233_t:CDS:1, partial [Dentiscutata erythropus]
TVITESLKHVAQFKLSRNITLDKATALQSVNETILATPPSNISLNDIKQSLLLQLDPQYFNI